MWMSYATCSTTLLSFFFFFSFAYAADGKNTTLHRVESLEDVTRLASSHCLILLHELYEEIAYTTASLIGDTETDSVRIAVGKGDVLLSLLNTDW